MNPAGLKNEGKHYNKKNIANKIKNTSLGYFGSSGDLSFDVDGSTGKIGESEDNKIRVTYSIIRRTVEIWIDGRPEDRFVRQNGSIVSAIDLVRSTMAIRFSETMVPNFEKDYSELRQARHLAIPKIVFLNISGRSFIIRNFHPVEGVRGSKIFVSDPIQFDQ